MHLAPIGTGRCRKLTTTALSDQLARWGRVLSAAVAVLNRARADVAQLLALAAGDRSGVLASDTWISYWRGVFAQSSCPSLR